MPIDMALPLFLSKEEFVYRPPPQVCKPALSSCLRFQQGHLVDQGALEDGCFSRRESRKEKKRVTFADHRGLSLTRVKVFSQFNDPIDIPLKVQAMFSSASALEDDALVLDFAQPASDYLRFRQQLEQNLVSLEHCILKERSLAGTVKVKNVAFEKMVKLRVTFDTWKSHMDVDCSYMKDTYPNSYSDTFSFTLSLPEQLFPPSRIEFAVCYEVEGRQHWDSNQGENYRIVWSSMKKERQNVCSSHTDSFDFGIHFDRYGSPTCSHGILPDWPSYAGYENSGPYY